ncbi:MAG: translation initiation factor IF-2 subunit gamma [Candidatus Bathyarchaeota archaeon]|nr:translation initiation factor IF-2 subunit gamma [Candidatus Bathyarchaeota archaeon]
MQVDSRLIPECNIGTAGHVDHGKTTLVEALTGVWTARHSEELRRGITIKLGYADMSIYRCGRCSSPYRYTNKPICNLCGSETELVRTVSFVDAPGHEILMATMLAGAAVMDGALLVIAADEKCPQPQTREHLMALKIVGVENIVVVQNKIDLVDRDRAMESYREIRKFLEEYGVVDVPIIPISAQHKVNIGYLLEAIERYIPTPKRDLNKPPLMPVVRSFDVNKPGTPVQELRGGVIGGSIIQGRLRVGDNIEIRPGVRSPDGSYRSLTTEIVSLRYGSLNVEEARCGGLVGVATKLDPYLTKADGMVGNMVGYPDQMPPIWSEYTVEYKLFEYVVGLAEPTRVSSISKGETLLLNVGTSLTVGVVDSVRSDELHVNLRRPVCAPMNQRIAISRRIADRWRLIGYGIIKA